MKKSELEDIWSVVSRGLSETVKSQVLVPSGRGGKYNARDYMIANCLLGEVRKLHPDMDFSKVTCKNDLEHVLPAAERFRLRYYTPCLAARYDELKEEQQRELFECGNWVATQKMNGVRGWLVCMPNEVKLFSRNYSDVDCTLLEYWGNIAQGIDEDSEVAPLVIDVEVVFEPSVDISADLKELGLETDSPLDAMVALLHSEKDKALGIQERYRTKYGKDLVCMRMIAPLYYKYKNYVDRSLGAGMDVYDEVLSVVRGYGLNVEAIPRCGGSRIEKENFLNRILAVGGEGVVFHNRDGIYCTSENRDKRSYVKLKRSVGDSINGVGMGDTIGAFVSGFKLGNKGTVNEGLVSTLEFSIWLNDGSQLVQKFIGAVSGLDMGLKRTLTVKGFAGAYTKSYIDDEGCEQFVSLNWDYDGRVAELSGQALSSVNQRLEHPRMLRWCDERDSNSCIYTKEYLDSQTTNIGIKYGVVGD